MVTARRIALERDAAQLYQLISNAQTELLPAQTGWLNETEFRHWLAEQLGGSFHELYVLEEPEGAIVGFALAYDYRVYDGHCLLRMYAAADVEQAVWADVLRLLLREYPLRKLFLEAVSTDKRQLALAYDLGFSKEMTLPEYRYQDGAYRDVFVLSLYRENAAEWGSI